MGSLGWEDRRETPIQVAYRQKGERRQNGFLGAIYVIGPGEELTHVEREALPLVNNVLDLTRAPVITIGGKRKSQPARVHQFLVSNPGFQGVFFLLPGSGNWDLGDGMIFVTSQEVLGGRRVSGGKPEEQLTNHRWLRDGRYVADQATMLHGKVIKMIAEGIELEPGAALMAECFVRRQSYVEHPLYDRCREVAEELGSLECRRTLLIEESARDFRALMIQVLMEKFVDAGARKVAEIPSDLTISASDVAPELVAQAETLGTIEVPGLGRRAISHRTDIFAVGVRAILRLTYQEIAAITAWPFADIGIQTEEGASHWMHEYERREVFFQSTEEDRWPKIREYFAGEYARSMRLDFPKNVPVMNPREADPPVTPDPVIWAEDLFQTGQSFRVYAMLTKHMRYTEENWSFDWTPDAKVAAEADAKARAEAASYIVTRTLEAEALTEVESIELPAPLPQRYEERLPTLSQMMAERGFTPEQFRIEGHGPIQVCVKNAEYGWSKLRDEPILLRDAQFAAQWWRKDGEMIVVFANATIKEFLSAVTNGLNLPEGKIQTVKGWHDSEIQRVKNEFCTEVREFAQILMGHPNYGRLTAKMRGAINSLTDAQYSLPNPFGLAAELLKEWAKAEVLRRHEESGEILVNWGGHFRVGGATNQSQYWVISPDGSSRLPDNERRERNGDGDKSWRLVGPDELAIAWSKAYTMAPHDFYVAKEPVNGLTQPQRETVARLEAEIMYRFESGRASPTVGEGWGLVSSELGRAAVRQLEAAERGEALSEPTPIVEQTIVNETVELVATPAPALVRERPAFLSIGGRDFRCPSGHSLRLSKSEAATYQSGGTVEVVCPFCHKEGIAKK